MAKSKNHKHEFIYDKMTGNWYCMQCPATYKKQFKGQLTKGGKNG